MSMSMRFPLGPSTSLCVPRRQGTQPRLPYAGATHTTGPTAMWTRPTPNRDEDFVKPSWVPQPNTQPDWSQPRREEAPLYAPVPEFRPAEMPDKGDSELPSAPKMPERRPDPIPAGNPKKEKPPQEDEKREAPPPKTKEAPKQ